MAKYDLTGEQAYERLLAGDIIHSRFGNAYRLHKHEPKQGQADGSAYRWFLFGLQRSEYHREDWGLVYTGWCQYSSPYFTSGELHYFAVSPKDSEAEALETR